MGKKPLSIKIGNRQSVLRTVVSRTQLFQPLCSLATSSRQTKIAISLRPPKVTCLMPDCAMYDAAMLKQDKMASSQCLLLCLLRGWPKTAQQDPLFSALYVSKCSFEYIIGKLCSMTLRICNQVCKIRRFDDVMACSAQLFTWGY